MSRTLTQPRKAPIPRTLTVDLREAVTGLDALPNGQARVDRTTGVIYGVKIVGNSSPNTHGVEDVDGTDYPIETRAAAKALYEGTMVNVDHPDRSKPHAERSARDRFAWLEKIEVRESGNFGNLHFLDPSDPLAIKMMNAAERKPEAFALSHNATGRGIIKDRRYIVQQITEVRSVDIVADGGTNASLLESKGTKPMPGKTIKLKTFLESATAKGKFPKLRKLIEEYDAAGDMDVPEDAEEGGPDENDHLYQAFKKCMAENPEKANKILKMLKADVPESEEEDDADKVVPDKNDKEKEAKEKKVEESLKRQAKDLCDLVGIEPKADLLESLVATRSETGMRKVLTYIRKNAAKPSGESPQSRGAGSVKTLADLVESRVPEKIEDQLAFLMG